MIRESLILALNHCAKHCTYCAATCLKDKAVKEYADCICLCLECAEVCRTTKLLLIMNSHFSDSALRLCKNICMACMKACANNPYECCHDCAKVCNATAQECGVFVHL